MRGVLTGGYVINGVAYVSMQCTWRIQRLIQGSCLLDCTYLKIWTIDGLPVIDGWLWDFYTLDIKKTRGGLYIKRKHKQDKDIKNKQRET